MKLEKFKNQILCIEAMELLKQLPDSSIDTVITDPPYGLRFAGNKWDYELPSVDVFKEILRVSKPGAMLLCFGGTRTFHRLACNIEDAGWQIRDCMMWLYGTGFPKGQNISKAIDKFNGARGKVIGKYFIKNKRRIEILPVKYKNYEVTKPGSKEAIRWAGWNTALKPAWEPIIVAMKPIENNYTHNALKFGVGGFNIEGSRLDTKNTKKYTHQEIEDCYQKEFEKGRWPTNVVFDEFSAKLLDLQSREPLGVSRFFYVAKACTTEHNVGIEGLPTNDQESQENLHPTVKPLKLIEYLCKLTATPTGGTVLDCFAGSFTTAMACRNTGRFFL